MQWIDITNRPDFKEAAPKARRPSGILRTTQAKPDPNLVYVIRAELEPGGRPVAQIVRSVGKSGPIYYYAADLRFVRHDGMACAWPMEGSRPWPVIKLELTTDHSSTAGAVRGFVPDMGDKLPGGVYPMAVFYQPGTDAEAKQAVLDRAEKWAKNMGLTIDETPRHISRAHGGFGGLKGGAISVEIQPEQLEGGQQ